MENTSKSYIEQHLALKIEIARVKFRKLNYFYGKYFWKLYRNILYIASTIYKLDIQAFWPFI